MTKIEEKKKATIEIDDSEEQLEREKLNTKITILSKDLIELLTNHKIDLDKKIIDNSNQSKEEFNKILLDLNNSFEKIKTELNININKKIETGNIETNTKFKELEEKLNIMITLINDEKNKDTSTEKIVELRNDLTNKIEEYKKELLDMISNIPSSIKVDYNKEDKIKDIIIEGSTNLNGEFEFETEKINGELCAIIIDTEVPLYQLNIYLKDFPDICLFSNEHSQLNGQKYIPLRVQAIDGSYEKFNFSQEKYYLNDKIIIEAIGQINTKLKIILRYE